MKLFPLLILGLTLGLVQPAAFANDLFLLHWRGRVYYTAANGKVASKRFTEKDVIRVIARNNGIDPRGLVLVYRPNAYDTAVVVKATGEVIADYQQIPDVTAPDQKVDVTSADGVTTVRQAYLFDEMHGSFGGQQIGTIFGIEKQRRDPNDNEHVISEHFHGTFQFAIPEPDNPDWQQGVYRGSFVTGRRIVDRTTN
ncbi:MAG TPA: hypothetical protein VFW05_19650 [Verrucomicrobiae bacterium]|jgi:hypothetical protein|nr:hypothetical protein [Verrucomicrobiae bacterium]